MTFIDKLFSRFGWGSNAFFKSTNSYMIGSTGPIWIETTKPRDLYETIPQLYNPVNKLASMFSNAEIKIVNDKGEEITDNAFHKFISNPNFAQSMNEWLNNYFVQKTVYGNTFMYKNKPSNLTKYPQAVWNLSPQFIQPILTGKAFDQVNMEGVISGYRYLEMGKEKVYLPKDILYTRITDIDNPFIGRSPLISLRFPLTNTKLSYEYRNVIMGKRGAIGMLSPEGAKDSMGAIPFTPTERKRITDQHLNSFGVQDGQTPILISETSLKWSPMTYPTRDLLLFEEIDANFMTILDTLGVNRNIYKDSSFENQKSGLVQTYQDTIFPQADQFAQDLTAFLGITNGKIEMCYDHLSIFEEDDVKEADTLAKNVNSIVQLYEKNIINKVGAVQMLISVSDIDIVTPAEDTIDKLNRMDALVANAVIKQLLVDEIRDLVNAKGITGGGVRPIEADAKFQQNQFSSPQ